MLLIACAFEEARRHHRRQRQRYESRDEDRHRQRDGKFAEEPADDTAHQEQRNEDGDQRYADRKDRKADLARAFEGRCHRGLAFLDIAGDVFQHDDGVVDYEPNGDRQRHERQVVETISRKPHSTAGAK